MSYGSTVDTVVEEDLIFVGDGHSIAKSAKCEDAFFVSELGLGVSDGVGSWSNYGIDPSLFSGSLMQESLKFIQRVQARVYRESVTQQEMECHRQALETSMESLYSLISSDSDSSVFSNYESQSRYRESSTNSLLS